LTDTLTASLHLVHYTLRAVKYKSVKSINISWRYEQGFEA